MAYIPKDAEWLLAQHVEEIRVQGRKRNVVHINYVLIEAKTPEDAYRKAKLVRSVMAPATSIRIRQRSEGFKTINSANSPI